MFEFAWAGRVPDLECATTDNRCRQVEMKALVKESNSLTEYVTRIHNKYFSDFKTSQAL